MIKEGDKVEVVYFNDIKVTGTVTAIYGDIAVVVLNNGEKVKRDILQLEPIPDKQEEEVKTVVIDEKQFTKLVVKKAVEKADGNVIRGLNLMLFGAELNSELFRKKVDND